MQDKDDEDYNIAEELRLLNDFLEEDTLLKYYAKQMGVYVDFTPKCHPEVAREGDKFKESVQDLTDHWAITHKNNFETCY